ncbi:MAG: hypothetical protein E4H01_00430, partial [Lysobacterales bacterium]
MTTSIQSRLGRAPEEGIKAPVICATTANITLSGTGQTIDGVVTANGDRVLVKDQTAPAENGIYLVSANAWERASDMNKDDDVAQAQMVADSNRSILYQVNVTSPWTPGSTSITFTSFLSAMPPMITLTLSDPVDLVDVSVPLVIGAVDPATAQHLEFDFQSVQSKSNATTASVLFLNPLGGDVNILADLVISGLVDGRDVAADGTAQDSHIADGTIHFTEGSISITASQVSDFATAVSSNAAVAANTAKVSNAVHTGNVTGGT